MATLWPWRTHSTRTNMYHLICKLYNVIYKDRQSKQLTGSPTTDEQTNLSTDPMISRNLSYKLVLFKIFIQHVNNCIMFIIFSSIKCIYSFSISKSDISLLAFQHLLHNISEPLFCST